MATLAGIGPFGGDQGGSFWDMSDTPQKLVSITVYRSKDGDGGQINGIRFEYEDSSGVKKDSGTYGTTSGANDKVVVINPGEYVIQFKGTATSANVKSLTIVKSTGDSTQFGDAKAGSEFSIPLRRAAIVGFFRRSGQVLNAIGAYVAPIQP